MLKTYGRELSLNIPTVVDTYLYIDIDHSDISMILTLPATATYIITNRPLCDLEEYIEAGYLNIAVVTKNSQITERFITEFIKTDYQDNKLKIIAQRLTELNASVGAEAKKLLEAMIALRDDDVTTFVKSMSVNLSSIITGLNDISAMIAFAKSLSQSSTRYSELVQKASLLDSALSEAEKYRELYEKLKKELGLVNTDKTELCSQLRTLQTQIDTHVISDEEIRNNAMFKELEIKLQAAESKCERIQTEFEEFKQDIENQAALMKDSSKDEIIKHLRDELQRMQATPYDKILAGMLPVLQETTTLAAEHILYFKEVRPTVYINGMIHWLASFMKIRYTVKQKKKYLILVFDPLQDNYTLKKYQKHEWAINTMPNPSNNILITNIFEYSRLKHDFHIEEYDCIICIDRCHVFKDCIDIKRCHKYYLTNTTNDMIDYDLDPSMCIGFYDKVPAGVQPPRYRITPWSDALAVADITRSGKFTHDQVFQAILEEWGVTLK